MNLKNQIKETIKLQIINLKFRNQLKKDLKGKLLFTNSRKMF